MAVDQAYCAALAPDFAQVESTRAATLISIASSQVIASRWGSQADYAVALLTLHTWQMGESQGRGDIASEEIGDLKISYQRQSKSNSDEYDSTSWGSEYKRLMRTKVRGPLVT